MALIISMMPVGTGPAGGRFRDGHYRITSSIGPTTSRPGFPSSADRTPRRCARLAHSWNWSSQPGSKLADRLAGQFAEDVSIGVERIRTNRQRGQPDCDQVDAAQTRGEFRGVWVRRRRTSRRPMPNKSSTGRGDDHQFRLRPVQAIIPSRETAHLGFRVRIESLSTSTCYYRRIRVHITPPATSACSMSVSSRRSSCGAASCERWNRSIGTSCLLGKLLRAGACPQPV